MDSVDIVHGFIGQSGHCQWAPWTFSRSPEDWTVVHVQSPLNLWTFSTNGLCMFLHFVGLYNIVISCQRMISGQSQRMNSGQSKIRSLKLYTQELLREL